MWIGSQEAPNRSIQTTLPAVNLNPIYLRLTNELQANSQRRALRVSCPGTLPRLRTGEIVFAIHVRFGPHK